MYRVSLNFVCFDLMVCYFSSICLQILDKICISVFC